MSPGDIPPPAATWTLPARHVGRRVLVYDRLPSTMPVAAALAADPAHAGTAVLAGEQTAGRGQYGRSWTATPRSSVLLGVLLFPPPPLRRPAVLTAWAAVAVADAVQSLVRRRPRIKWPNDVLVGGHKVCGILIESTGAAVVTGIGLNVTQSAADFAATGLPRATSLALLSGRTFDTHDVARRLLLRLDAEYAAAGDDGLSLLEERWRRRVGLLGRAVDVEAVDGRVRRGRLRSLTFDGLELEEGGSVVRLAPEAVRHLTVRVSDQ